MKFIRRMLANPILSGSVVMIGGSNLINFLNYLYHFVMGRLLGPSGYGELAALFSVLTLLTIVPSSFGLVIVRFIATSQDKSEIAGLISFFRRLVLIIGAVVLLLAVVFASGLSQFLRIDQPILFVLMAIAFIITTLAFVNKSVLQGLVRFKEFVLAGLVENGLKLGLGAGLVWLGWSVMGAAVGLVLAFAAGWLVSWWCIKEFRVGQALSAQKVRQVMGFTWPVLIQSITTTSLYSADIILVKHFFSAELAGMYAGMSALSRVILFSSGPVTSVMFPWIAKRHQAGQSYWSFFGLSLGLTLLICSGVLAIYLLVPNLAIQALYGAGYLSGVGLLFNFGVFTTLLTLAILLINFFLSLGKTRVVILPLIAAVAQIVGINFWHQDLLTVIGVSIWVATGLVISLLIYLARLWSSQR